MGLFSRKDHNVIAVLYETAGRYRVNGNRGKGSDADKILTGVKRHEKTLCWVVFDQKGGFVEGDNGRGKDNVPAPVLKKLLAELPLNKTVREILAILESGKQTTAAKPLEWTGYPRATT